MEMAIVAFPEHGVEIVDPDELEEVFTQINYVFREAEYSAPPHNNGHNRLEQPETDELFIHIAEEICDDYQYERQAKFTSVCWRLYTLCNLIRMGTLSPWVREDPDRCRVSLPPSVFQVAALFPLKTKNGYNEEAFIEAVRILSPGDYLFD